MARIVIHNHLPKRRTLDLSISEMFHEAFPWVGNYDSADESYHFTKGKAAAEAGEPMNPPYPDGSDPSRIWKDGYRSVKKSSA